MGAYNAIQSNGFILGELPPEELALLQELAPSVHERRDQKVKGMKAVFLTLTPDAKKKNGVAIGRDYKRLSYTIPRRAIETASYDPRDESIVRLGNAMTRLVLNVIPEGERGHNTSSDLTMLDTLLDAGVQNPHRDRPRPARGLHNFAFVVGVGSSASIFVIPGSHDQADSVYTGSSAPNPEARLYGLEVKIGFGQVFIFNQALIHGGGGFNRPTKEEKFKRPVRIHGYVDRRGVISFKNTTVPVFGRWAHTIKRK